MPASVVMGVGLARDYFPIEFLWNDVSLLAKALGVLDKVIFIKLLI